MDFLTGITILLIYELAGEVSSLLLRLPIPGPVVGMMFLFVTLMWRGQSPKSLNLASETLLSHFSLLFVPAGVGVMLHFERISQESMIIGLTLVFSTAITMIVTAIVMANTLRLLSWRERHNA